MRNRNTKVIPAKAVKLKQDKNGRQFSNHLL